jgi:hypothetical protein
LFFLVSIFVLFGAGGLVFEALAGLQEYVIAAG